MITIQDQLGRLNWGKGVGKTARTQLSIYTGGGGYLAVKNIQTCDGKWCGDLKRQKAVAVKVALLMALRLQF